MTTGDYCGLVCSEIIEKQTAILEEIKDFSKYNPEFAQEMCNRIIALSEDYKRTRFIVPSEPTN